MRPYYFHSSSATTATWATIFRLRCTTAIWWLMLPYLSSKNDDTGDTLSRRMIGTTAFSPERSWRTSSSSSSSSSSLPLWSLQQQFLELPFSTTSRTRLWQQPSQDGNDNDNDSFEDTNDKNSTQSDKIVHRIKQTTQASWMLLRKWGNLLRQNGSNLRNLVRGKQVEDASTTSTTSSDERDENDVFLKQNSTLSSASTSSSISSNETIDAFEFSSQQQQQQQQHDLQVQLPKGPRWAIAHPDIDLSGTWKPLITKEFQREYDVYLQNCGTSYLFRQVVLNFASTTRETIHQLDQGRILQFHGTAPGGAWKRSLISSGADFLSHEYQPHVTEFLDPDKELVQVEAWWEEDGRVHKSFMRNKPKVQGGVFETKRYLMQDETTGQEMLVCESTFHPSPHHLQHADSSPFQPAFVRWKYQRV